VLLSPESALAKPASVKFGVLGGLDSTISLCEVDPPSIYTTTSAMQDNPLNLSISFSGGQENNCDSLSNGE
jgi:hypothetical protein